MRNNKQRRFVPLAILLTLTLSSLWPADAQETGQQPAVAAPFKAGEILVKFRESAPADAVLGTPARYDATQLRTLYGSDVQLWQLPEGSEMATIERLLADPLVEYAEPNYIYHALVTPNDPYFDNQWAHTIIQSPAAWDISTGSANVTIAIIDTGIDEGHPDLAAKIVAGYDFWDYDTNPHDWNGHGTHVAGIAAAITNNATGVVGMNWQARIMPVRVLNEEGLGYLSDITDGITWAFQHGAKVLSLSLGSTSYSQSMQDAINNAHAAGSLVVAAMGNCRTYDPPYCPVGNPTVYPAACNNVMAVAATGPSDQYAPYSQYGAHCDIAAPGGDMVYLHDPDGIYSTLPTYDVYMTAIEGYYKNYDYVHGTSQATPYVAGLAALVWSVDPSLTPDEVQAVIEDAAVDLGSVGWDSTYGHGRIDALGALASLAPLVAPTLAAINNPDGDGNYLVDWNTVPGATSYTLQEDENPGFASPAVRYSGANSQFSVTGKGPGTWYYRVQASNSTSDSPWSNTQSVMVKPNAPTLNPIVNPSQLDEYLLSWSASTGATGYTLQEDDNSSFPSPVVRWDGSALQYNVTGQPGGTWYYRVRAYNAAGTSPWSTIRSTIVSPPALNPPVLNPIDNPDGDGNYLVDWSTVSGASYTLEQSTSVYFESPTTAYNGSATHLDVIGQPGGTWYYRVRAFRLAGKSPWSNPQSVIVTPRIFLPFLLRSSGPGNVSGLPISEGFEAGTMPPTNWQVVPGSAYSWVSDSSHPYAGASHASVYPEPSGQLQDEVLLSPPFQASQAQVQFFSLGSPGQCRDGVADNCDLNVWLVVGDWGGGDDTIVYAADQDWESDFQWFASSVDLTSYLPAGTPVRLAFQYTGQDGALVSLDAIQISGQ